jgi:RNA polymerase sigma-70 factor, ECF subfamily
MIADDLNPNPKNNYKELVEKIIESDSTAFEKLYFKFVQRIYYFTKRYITTEAEIEEVVQEVFTKLWEHRMNLRTDMSINGYLLTITKNTIFNQFRRNLNHQAYCQYLITYNKNHTKYSNDDVLFNELKKIVEEAIEKLPPQRQKIFKMSRFNGFAYKEISKKLGLAEKTVEAHIRLAIRDIRRVLEPEYSNTLC